MPPSDAAVELQLAIGKRGLGIELSRPAKAGPVTVTELSLTLPSVRFPIDVSGGVRRFRHRRGTLERLTVELRAKDLVREWAPRLAGLISRGAPDVVITPRPHGATVAMNDPESERALAFEVAVLAEHADLLVIPFSARGLGLPRPAIEIAARALQALLRGAASQKGVRFRIAAAYAKIARDLLPEAGARAPEAGHVRTAAMTPAGDAWILQGYRDAVEPEHSSDALLAAELSDQLADADEALLAKDDDRARVLYLHALSKLPRHAEVCARVADIDRLIHGREEAARGTLDDAPFGPATAWLSAELLERSGDGIGARLAFRRAADAEPVALLAAFGLARAALLESRPLDALALLDAAIARVPTHPILRERRARARLALGRLRDALSDYEELEAVSRGHRARHAVWMRAATAWLGAGHRAEAKPLFERALRFAPDDARSLAGLGVSMLASGQPARAIQLLGRAFSIPTREPPPDAYRVDLAEALARELGDRAAAVARLGEVADDSDEAALARGLEGRFRREVDDASGASLAYARMRDVVLSRAVPERYKARIAELLREAIAFEERRNDLVLAASHRAAIEQAFPTLTATAKRDHLRPQSDSEPPPPTQLAPEPLSQADERRAVELIARYRDRPEDHDLVDELAAVLSRLGRSHELLALLAARLDEADERIRARLAPLHREVLARLEREARERGHDNEAQLFRDALVGLGGAIEP